MTVAVALAVGLALGVALTLGWTLVLPVHRHRWSKWSDLPSTRIVSDVRHCQVCNKRQTRQP